MLFDKEDGSKIYRTNPKYIDELRGAKEQGLAEHDKQ